MPGMSPTHHGASGHRLLYGALAVFFFLVWLLLILIAGYVLAALVTNGDSVEACPYDCPKHGLFGTIWLWARWLVPALVLAAVFSRWSVRGAQRALGGARS